VSFPLLLTPVAVALIVATRSADTALVFTVVVAVSA
jgi:hypothetical protein